jgi:hypothetical protein
MTMATLISARKSPERGTAAGSNPKEPGDSEHMAPPTIHLGHEHLKALGIHKAEHMPKIGSKIKISGLVHVGATNADQGDHIAHGAGKGPRHSMTLHLHKMEMGTDDQPGMTDVDQEAERTKGAKAEMDKALSRGAGSESAKPKAAGGKEGQQGG